MRLVAFTVAVFGLCALGAQLASSAQLVENGDFAEGTEFWTPIPFGGAPAPTIVWSPLDRGGSDESGSGEVHQSALAGNYGDVAQCVPVSNDEAVFDLSGWVLISPDNPNAMATGGFRVVWYPTANCSGGGSSVLSPTTTLQDQWIQLERQLFYPLSGTQSARVLLEIFLVVEGQPITVNFDDVRLIPEPAAASGFLASTLALGFLSLRKRCVR